MCLEAVLSRFAEQSPVTVMAQVLLDRALEPGWIDGLFEAHRQRQYKRELLFSTAVELMSLVSLGLQPSVHPVVQARKGLSVSLAALYDKINRMEPGLARAQVAGSAERLAPVLKEVRHKQEPFCPGYRVLVVDGRDQSQLHGLDDRRATRGMARIPAALAQRPWRRPASTCLQRRPPSVPHTPSRSQEGRPEKRPVRESAPTCLYRANPRQEGEGPKTLKGMVPATCGRRRTAASSRSHTGCPPPDISRP
jgi:hypothetical protein